MKKTSYQSMKKTSYVEVPRWVIEAVLDQAEKINSCQNAEHLKDDPTSAYAFVLSQSTGRASAIKNLLEDYLNA